MKNNNKGLYIIIAILLILVMVLGGYIVYDKVNNKQDNSTANDNDKTISVKDDVNVKITLGDYSINMSSPNNKLELKGTIDVSYDSNKYYGLALYGYCLDENNNKYEISGPADGRTLFGNGNTELVMSEVISPYQNQDISSNLVLSYCKIDKISLVEIISSKEDKTYKMAINVEKYYNTDKKNTDTDNKTLYDNISNIRTNASNNIKNNEAWNDAANISKLFSQAILDEKEFKCSLNENDVYMCGEENDYKEYIYSMDLTQLTYGEKKFNLTLKNEVNNALNYMTYLKYKGLYDNNKISKDVLSDTDNYCIGYSYDKDYFYFDYYTGNYNKELWYALNPTTGECDLQNKKYSHSYRINRNTLVSEKVVK